MNQVKVTYREIARMLVKALPVQDEAYAEKVDEYTESVQRMGAEAKTALKSAYIFAHKVPVQDREDMFQELALAVLEARTKDERLAYTVARCDWRNWWEKYYTRQHYLAGSLNEIVENDEGGKVELGELLVGEVEYERLVDGKLDGQALFDKLPSYIKPLVVKRLLGRALTGAESSLLTKYTANHVELLIA